MDKSPSFISRLAFIKYLYTTSLTQSKAPVPLCYTSLLMMHDAVELFLYLTAEKLNLEVNKNTKFMDYWKLINGKLENNKLPKYGSMDRLNNARIMLKHYGTFPSQLDLEGFRENTIEFFKESTSIIFDLQFENISMIEFVNPESARNRLKDSVINCNNGDLGTALENIAIAFEQIIRDYENRKMGKHLQSPFKFTDGWKLPSNFEIECDIGRGLNYHGRISLGKLGDFVDRVNNSLEILQDSMKILALGIDYRKYAEFIRLAPEACQSGSGEWSARRRYYSENEKPIIEDVQYCLEFVIECSLKLREFDYSFESRKIIDESMGNN